MSATILPSRVQDSLEKLRLTAKGEAQFGDYDAAARTRHLLLRSQHAKLRVGRPVMASHTNLLEVQPLSSRDGKFQKKVNINLQLLY
jgi:hypothetical protein